MHAHVETTERDCDGRYDDDYIVTPKPGAEEFEFVAETMGAHLPTPDPGTDVQVTFTSTGFHYSHPTDEGYRAVSVEWCHHDCNTDARSYRDHTAEVAGY